jgi:hypothetical protein
MLKTGKTALPAALPMIGRREFIGAAAAALFAGVVIQITGCGSDSATGPTASAGDIVGVVEDNHSTPHSAIITKAEVDSGGDVTLNIQGAADHNHQVALTAAQVAAIKAGTHTAVQSTVTNSHSHGIHFN